MATTVSSVADICAGAKRASRVLATLGSEAKNVALEAIAAALLERTPEILEANARDLDAGREAGLSEALMDRLALSERRVADMAAGTRKIAALPDPVGEVIDGFRLPNGLAVRKVRVPLGVVAVVYEARPNVTRDAAALCLQSGNAIALRGSSTAVHSNAVLDSHAAAAPEVRMDAATVDDWDTEYLALELAVGVVDSAEEAISHIGAHGSGHSEAIVTRDTESARAFQLGVDAACVYVNASTRFTDGGEFGMGAEIGNSTQKLHARGPIGIRELCTYKYLVDGSGQVRA